MTIDTAAIRDFLQREYAMLSPFAGQALCNEIDRQRVEITQLTALAYIGDHYFSDNTYKARYEEAASEIARLRSAERIKVLEMENARLRKAVLKYGMHTNACAMNDHLACLCSCGFSEIHDAIVAEGESK